MFSYLVSWELISGMYFFKSYFKLTNYIKSHIRGNTRLKEHNIYEDSGWEIKEWSSNDKKY
ncbi:hypothetical protein, partial [Mycoplasmopsis bovis]|uniref:hypothetical protein n=1 Tax=Mycoplasmopsis bovis TaxID=28903 RepID=UPI003D2CBA1E